MSNSHEPLPTRAIVVNTTGFALAFAAWVMFGPSIRVIAAELNLSASQAAFLKSIPIFTGSVLRVPIGMLADRYGARLTFPATLLVGAVAAIITSFQSTVTALIMGGLAIGLVGTTFVIGVRSVAAWSPRPRQGFALGLFGAGNIGTAITTFSMPLLLPTLGWRMTFQVYGVVLAITAVGYWATLRDPSDTRRASTFAQLVAPLKSGEAWLFGLLYMATFGGFVGTTLIITDLYIDGYQVSLTQAGLLATIFTFTASLCRIPGGWFSDRLGANAVLKSSLVALILPFLAISAGLSLVLTVFLTFIGAVAMGFGMSATLKFIPERFPGSEGSVGGIVGALGGLAGFYLPLASAWTGQWGAFAQVLPVAVLGIVALLSTTLIRPVGDTTPSLQPAKAA